MSSFQSIKDRVAEALRGYPPSRRYLVGVSGGRDSVVLLHLLHALGYRKLVICHLDHGLRGQASRADARFVEQLSAKLGLEVELGREDVKAHAGKERVSVETAAREVRLAFFRAVARRRRCRTLILGHHADDQVETFLFNLLRGAGSGGLGGMRPISSQGTLTVVRPLLQVWRAEISSAAEEENIPFREDASNASLEHTRNRLRQEGIPALEEAMGRDPRPALLRTCQMIAAEHDWMETLVPKFDTEIPVTELRPLPLALQRRAILRWLRERDVPLVGFDEVERVRALLEPGTAVAKVNLPGNRHVRRRAKRIFIE